MKGIRKLAPAALLLLAGVVALAAPAAAWKLPVAFYEINCVTSPGTQWTAGNTLHIRGSTGDSILYDAETFEIVGTNTVILNANINLKSGQQTYFGTFSSTYLVVSETGTFDGSWHGNASAEKLFAGKAVGHGRGDAQGIQARLNLQGLDPFDLPLELLIILSQPPWTDCEEIGGVLLDSGRFQGPGSG